MLARPVLSFQDSVGDYPLQNDVGIHSNSGMVVPLARFRYEMVLGGQASQGYVSISTKQHSTQSMLLEGSVPLC